LWEWLSATISSRQGAAPTGKISTLLEKGHGAPHLSSPFFPPLAKRVRGIFQSIFAKLYFKMSMIDGRLKNSL
jgi:hypothetical protein